MSKLGLMMDRVLDPESVPTLIDLGYIRDRAARDRADALVAHGISRRNLSIEGHGRLLMKCPKRKTKSALEKFPIVKGSTYWQCTHHWLGLGQDEECAPVPH